MNFSLSPQNQTRLKCAPGWILLVVYCFYLTGRATTWAGGVNGDPAAAAVSLALCYASFVLSLALGLWFMPIWYVAVPKITGTSTGQNTASASAAESDTNQLTNENVNANTRPRFWHYYGMCFSIGLFCYCVATLAEKLHKVKVGTMDKFRWIEWLMMAIGVLAFVVTGLLAYIIIARRPRHPVAYQQYQMS